LGVLGDARHGRGADVGGVTRTIPLKIEFARAPNGDVWWTQNADDKGEAACDGCGERRRVVYSSMLQWCQNCWPLAAPHDTSSQAKDWASKREGQERDYGWSPS